MAITQSSLRSLANRDLLKELLADKKSPNTRRTYAKSLRDFFETVAHSGPSPKLLAEFLTLDHYSAVALVLK